MAVNVHVFNPEKNMDAPNTVEYTHTIKLIGTCQRI